MLKKSNKIVILIFYIKWYVKNFKFILNFFFILQNKFFNFFRNKEINVNSKDLENFFTSEQILKKLFKISKINKFSNSKVFQNRKKILKKYIKKFGGAADINLIYNICLKKKAY